MKSLLAREREKYHKLLLENSALTIDNNGVPSNADKSSKLSISIATRIATSAKWTMRSDRAQNSRTEALGLIRNRKENLPHIAVVTGEPLPGRFGFISFRNR